MNCKRRGAWMFLILSGCLGLVGAGPFESVAVTEAQPAQQDGAITLITPEELKAKIARNEPLTIIDVRATSSYVNSDSMIKGAIFVKLRRLKSRLSFPPLKAVRRDSEVIAYCACPHDESSVHAAQILSAAGFKRVRVLQGGWRMWLKVNGPVAPKPGRA